jgi:DNA-binding transcriptional regulator PaaX
MNESDRLARENLRAYCAIETVVNYEKSPLHSLILLMIAYMAEHKGYCTYTNLFDHLHLKEVTLKVSLSRLKGQGFILEEQGFYQLSPLGKSRIDYLKGNIAEEYRKHAKKVAKKLRPQK